VLNCIGSFLPFWHHHLPYDLPRFVVTIELFMFIDNGEVFCLTLLQE
jgi:hypothetical protein